MTPAPFDYVRAESVDHAVALLGEYGDDAKILAGGHSLLPLMKLRLAVPTVLVDLGEVHDLSYVRDAGAHLEIGALTSHDDLATSAVLGLHAPLLAHVAGQVGDPQVRHRGTIGGSIAHADPASDEPAALVALRATFVVRGPSGTRSIPVDSFFTGFLETSMEPGEVLVEIHVPKTGSSPWSFQKFSRRAQDWAIVGVACIRNDATGIGLVNMGATPLRARAAEEVLADGGDVEAASVTADVDTAPGGDLNATPEYRRHLARVLLRRALLESTAPGA